MNDFKVTDEAQQTLLAYMHLVCGNDGITATDALVILNESEKSFPKLFELVHNKVIFIDCKKHYNYVISRDYLGDNNQLPTFVNHLLYVNVYAITRHYAGPEEGGNWVNDAEPLASVPIEAEHKRGHGASCVQCYNADNNIGRASYCRDGDDDELSNEVSHLVAKNEIKLLQTKAELARIYHDEQYGNIYHSTGGQEISIVVESHPAEQDNPDRSYE